MNCIYCNIPFSKEHSYYRNDCACPYQSFSIKPMGCFYDYDILMGTIIYRFYWNDKQDKCQLSYEDCNQIIKIISSPIFPKNISLQDLQSTIFKILKFNNFQ